jgi:hypothetical protein
MNQATAILIGAGMIAVAALAATTNAPQAQFGSSNGRYMMFTVATPNDLRASAFRLDTSSGEVRLCSNGRCGAVFETEN